jgi:hypothetical protein
VGPVPRRRWLANLATVLVAVVVSLALAEAAIHVSGFAVPPSFYRLDPDVGDALAPGAEGWWTREGNAFVRISAQGLRDREHAIPKPPGTLRIAVLGDSFAEALQVDQSETFWSLLERDLVACPALGGRPVEVVNLGVSGYGTAQELLALEHKGLRFEPDLVLLLFTTGNDVRNNSKPLQRGGRPYARVENGAVVFDMSFLDKSSSRLRLSPLGSLGYAGMRHSEVIRLLALAPDLWKARREAAAAQAAAEAASAQVASGPAEAPAAPPPPPTLGLDDGVYTEPQTPVWRDAWELTEALLRAVRDLGLEHGARFALATGSSPIQVHPDPAVRAQHAAALGEPDLLRPDRRLEAFAAREGIPFAMAAPRLAAWAERNQTCVHGFPNAEPCAGHWNAAGHAQVAAILTELVCDEIAPDLVAGAATR